MGEYAVKKNICFYFFLCLIFPLIIFQSMFYTARHLVLTLVGIIVSDWWYIWHYADGVGTIVADLSVPDPPLSHFGF